MQDVPSGLDQQLKKSSGGMTLFADDENDEDEDLNEEDEEESEDDDEEEEQEEDEEEGVEWNEQDEDVEFGSIEDDVADKEVDKSSSESDSDSDDELESNHSEVELKTSLKGRSVRFESEFQRSSGREAAANWLSSGSGAVQLAKQGRTDFMALVYGDDWTRTSSSNLKSGKLKLSNKEEEEEDDNELFRPVGGRQKIGKKLSEVDIIDSSRRKSSEVDQPLRDLSEALRSWLAAAEDAKREGLRCVVCSWFSLLTLMYQAMIMWIQQPTKLKKMIKIRMLMVRTK